MYKRVDWDDSPLIEGYSYLNFDNKEVKGRAISEYSIEIHFPGYADVFMSKEEIDHLIKVLTYLKRDLEKMGEE